MLKTNTIRNQCLSLSSHAKTGAALTVVGIFAVSTIAMPMLVSADQFDEQIRALQSQNNQTKSQVSTLKAQASSYQEAIANLQNEINAVQNLINENEARQADLEQQIKVQEAELAKQKRVLGENIKAMYVENEMSTIEMLATSKDLSDFVDKETYRNAVQRKIQDTMAKITKLQDELNSKKQQVEALLKEQQAQRSSLDANRVEQANLLAMNQSQQADFNALLKSNNDKIADLRARQAAENARLFGSGGGVIGGGGYPWGGAACLHTGQVDGPCPNYDWAVGGSIWNWSTGGYGYRNCTDWVSWRIRSTGGYVPSGLGNAKEWDDRAPGYGYRVSNTPEQGAAAVSNAGDYGHVMYVESVSGDGSILISDYNRAGTGKYNTATLTRVGPGQYRNGSNGAVSTLTFVIFK